MPEDQCQIWTGRQNGGEGGILTQPLWLCVLQSGVEIPYRTIKTNIGDSLNLVIQIERRPGIWVVSGVLEIESYDPEVDRYGTRVAYVRKEQR